MAAKRLEVVITGTAKDVVGAFKEAGDSADTLGSRIQGLGKVAAIGVAGLVAGAGAAAVGLYKVGENIDAAFDKIRVQTGATGPALESLQGSFRAVAATTASSFDDVSTVIGKVNSTLGLTGDPLNALSSQLLNLSRITKTDVNENVDQAARLFNNWGIAAQNQTGTLDILFRASQQTGVGMSTLMQAVSENGVVMRTLGFDVSDTAALFATLGKAGIDTSSVMPALTKSLATAGKEGKNAGQLLDDTFKTIRTAPTDAAAAGAAISVFGAKAGPKLAAAIREGKLSYEDLQKAITSGGDTINAASADTEDFAEKWQKFTNKLQIAVEPLASKVFGFLGDSMDKLGPYIDMAVKWLGDTLPGAMQNAADVIGPIVSEVAGGVVAMVQAFISGGNDITSSGFAGVLENVGLKARGVFDYLTEHRELVIGALIAIGATWTASMAASAVATIAATWPLLLIVAVIGGVVAAVLWAWNNWQGFHDFIVSATTWLAANIPPLWAQIQAGVQVVVEWFMSTALPIIQQFINWIVEQHNNLVAWVTAHWAQIQQVVMTITAVISAIIDGFTRYVQWGWENWGTSLTNIAQAVWGVISGTVEYFVTIIRNTIEFVMNIVQGNWGGAWQNLVNLARAQIDWIIGIVQNLANVVGNVIGGLASTITSIGAGMWDGLSSGLSGVINGIKSLWNSSIGSLSWTVPDWVPELGGHSISAPRLHTGGTFLAPTAGGEGLALLRDREQVIPPASSSLSGVGAPSGGGDTYVTIEVHVEGAVVHDDAALGRYINGALAAYQRNGGRIAFAGT